MKQWQIVPVNPELIDAFCARFKVHPIAAQLFLRRGLTKPEELAAYLEDDLRFTHNPFLFKDMEDIVERLQQAKSEGEQVLVFGDRDADGVTSTATLVRFFQEWGLDCGWQVPLGDEPYGLSVAAVQAHAERGGTLIVTVDCGITNVEEIKLAQDLGVDVIVIDHHNPLDGLPAAIGFINPKLPDSGYPFAGVSAAVLAAKLVWALRFSDHELYNQEFCLVNIHPGNQSLFVEGVVMRNFVPVRRLSETVAADSYRLVTERIIPFMQALPILVFDWPSQKLFFQSLFGDADVQVQDLAPMVWRQFPSFAGKSLLRLVAASKSARYQTAKLAEIDGLIQSFLLIYGSKITEIDNRYLESLSMVAISLLADMMPMIDENRILMRRGLASLSKVADYSPGLHGLLVDLDLARKPVASRDIGWKIAPQLNSAGRMGRPDTALKLLLSRDPAEASALVRELSGMNDERRRLGDAAWQRLQAKLPEILARHHQKLVVVTDPEIPRGITGILASRITREFDIPAIVVAELEATMVGSIRTVRGLKAPEFLTEFADLLEDFGGHDAAGGFFLKKTDFAALASRIEAAAAHLNLEEPSAGNLHVDIVVPARQLSEEIWKLNDLFVPSGQEFDSPLYCVQGLTVVNASIIGKDSRHLSLELSAEKAIWPAVFWDGAASYRRDFSIGDQVDIVGELGWNQFRADRRPQLVITGIRPSQSAASDRS